MKSKRSFFWTLSFLLLLCNQALAQTPRLVLPVGHTENILSACFSQDGKYILTGSSDKTIKLWEAQTGMLLKEFFGHKEGVSHVAFSEDGKKIISSDYSNINMQWNLKDPVVRDDTTVDPDIIDHTWEETHEPPYAPKSFYNLNNTRLAVVQKDSLVVFNNNTHQKIAAIKIPYLIIQPVFSPDGNIIFCSTPTTERDNYNRVIYNITTGKAMPVQIDGLSYIFSPDSKKLLSINSEQAMLWNLLTGEPISVLKGSTSRPVDGPVFNADNNKIITIDQSNNIRMWASDAAILEPSTHGKTTLGISLTHDKKNIIKSSEDSTSIYIVSLENDRLIKQIKTGKPTHNFEAPDMSDAKKISEYVSRLPVFTALLNPQQTKLAITTGPPGSGLWDLETGKFLKGYLMDDYSAANYWSPDGKKLLITAKIQPPMLCDGLTGLVTDTFRFHGKSLEEFRKKTEKERAEPNRKKQIDSLSEAMGIPPEEVQPENADQLWTEANYVTAAAFSPDGNMVVMGVTNGSITAWSTKNGKELYCSENPDYSGAGQNSWINKILFSADGKIIATASWDQTVKLRDAATGKLIANIKDHHSTVNNIQFSPDGKELLSVADTGAIKIWSATDGQYMGELRKPLNSLSDIQFSSDSKQVTSTSSDNCMNVWDVQTRKLLYSFFQVDSSDYMFILPSGYYKASGSAAKKLHYVTKDFDVMTFEQLDVKYNRPDKILEATGSKNKFLAGSYRNAYYKRLQKLGIDSSSFVEGYSMPVAELQNRDRIADEQNSEDLTLHITAKDSIFMLDRFNVWINEVPLFGMKGVSIRKERKNIFDTTITIRLSHGQNRIETSVANINGIESYRKPLLVKCNADNKDPGKVYFVGVGINEFADPSNNLKWCVQDIRDLAKALQQKYGNRLVVVDTLFNEHATRTDIRNIKQKLYKTGVNDEVIFSYSGHGLLSKDYDYYISSYTINFNDPKQGGIPYDEIENMLDSIPARKKILLLDACNSGELDKDEMKKIQAATVGLAQNQTSISSNGRGAIVTATGDSATRVGLQNSFDLMQSLFVNVGKGTGAIVISASGGVQFAQERSELGHGVFTYSVIEAINKFPNIKVSAFRKYIGDRVTELTNGLQKPTTRNEPVAVDWEIW